ncbi:hypothetical protein RU98_GL003130 [Enterococcus caccae]|nr:hypothetical protein RU98_GL003130 [Enterococcus caccae]
MLAHVMPKGFFFQLRTFDVPLMAFLIGASYVKSKQKDSVLSYIWKRFKRLIVPAWIFLSIYFIIITVECLLLRKEFLYTKEILLKSYTLESGIGYVWIIRVFFLVSILLPALYLLSKKSETNLKTAIYFSAMLLIQFILCKISNNLLGDPGEHFRNYIANPFGYSILAFIGMKVSEQNVQKNNKLSVIILTIFIVVGISARFGHLQTFKYPPAPYFLAYGTIMSMSLYNFLSRETNKRLLSKISFLEWISKHSLELYYWHILVLVTINLMAPKAEFLVKFVALAIGTFSLTIIQIYIQPNLLSGKFSFKSKSVIIEKNTHIRNKTF